MKCFTCAVPHLPSLVGWQDDTVLGIMRLRLCGLQHLPTLAYLLHTADPTQMCIYQMVNLRVFSRHSSVPELPLFAQVRVPGTEWGQTNPNEQRKVHCRAQRVVHALKSPELPKGQQSILKSQGREEVSQGLRSGCAPFL